MAENQRDAIAEVYDSLAGADDAAAPVEAAPEPAAPDAEAAPAEETSAEKDQRERDEKGRFAAKSKDEEPAEKPAVKPKAKDAAGVVPAPAPTASTVGSVPPPDGAAPIAAAPKGPRAPATWKIVGREKWDAVPEEAKAEILRREEEHIALATSTSQQRRQWGEAQAKLAPYEPYLRSMGVAPLDAAARLLGVEQTLRMGSLPQKKAIFASMARDYGLSAADIGEAVAEGSNGHHQPVMQPPQQFQDPRVDQLLAQQQATQAEVITRQIDDFAKTHEYLDDVRETMAGLMEAGAAKGLQDAYDIALALPKHKDLRDHMAAAEQKKQAALKAKLQDTQRSKAAGGSVKSSPVEGSRAKVVTQRQAIAELYDELERR